MDGIDGEVWGTWSLAAGRVFGYVFSASLTHAVDIRPRDLNYMSSGGSRHLFNQGDATLSWIAVNVRIALEMETSFTGQAFSDLNPLTLTPCGQVSI